MVRGTKKRSDEFASGEATDDEIDAVVGVSIEAFRARGAIDEVHGTARWRALSRLIAGVELEAYRRSCERDAGYYGGTPSFPPLTEPPPHDLEAEAVSLNDLFTGFVSELRRSGKGAATERRWKPCIAALTEFLKHDDARRLTRQDVIRWRDDLLLSLAPKTVRDAHLTALKAILQWGIDLGRLPPQNAAASVKVRVRAKVQSRERGLTDEEAVAILKASVTYAAPERSNPRTTESVYTAAAKRWIPWLCAFTGARVAEIAQLRKADVRLDDAVPHIRITPDAGSTKTGLFRDVPLHPQLIQLGFDAFVRSSDDGPLFFDGKSKRNGSTHPAKQVAQRLAVWVRSLNVISVEVDPNHGWRHRMKTVARNLGLEMRVVDAIQGHAPRTAGERYGDVSLQAQAQVVRKLPFYEVGAA